MASVAELIAAAEAQKSPFVSMAEGAAQGFGKAQNQDLDRAKGMMDLYKSQQDYQYKQMLNMANEQILKRHLNELSGDEGGPLPTQKFKTTFGMNKTGPYFRQESVPEGSQKSAGQRTVYEDAAGKRRYGTYDKATGKVVQNPDDAFAPMPAKATGGKGRSGGGGVNEVTLNDKATKKAVEMYLSAHPDKVVLDLYDVPTNKNTLGSDDYSSQEFQRYLKQSREMLLKGPNAEQPKGGFGSMVNGAPAGAPATPGKAVESPEAYLKSMGAKVTPANVAWAKKKMAGK